MRTGPLVDTQQDSRRAPFSGLERKVAFLVRALECDEPRAGASRHCLEGLERVNIERGARGYFRQTLGEDAALTLCIPDPKISAKHASLRMDGEGWLFEDAGSRDGSIVAAAAVTRWRQDLLRHQLGQLQILIGSTTLTSAQIMAQ